MSVTRITARPRISTQAAASLALPATLTKAQRHLAHVEAVRLGLQHASAGTDGVDRQLTVSKPARAAPDLMEREAAVARYERQFGPRHVYTLQARRKLEDHRARLAEGHAVEGHTVDGHAVEGHAVEGHAVEGHAGDWEKRYERELQNAKAAAAACAASTGAGATQGAAAPPESPQRSEHGATPVKQVVGTATPDVAADAALAWRLQAEEDASSASRAREFAPIDVIQQHQDVIEKLRAMGFGHPPLSLAAVAKASGGDVGRAVAALLADEPADEPVAAIAANRPNALPYGHGVGGVIEGERTAAD
jgi:hypothetical protein